MKKLLLVSLMLALILALILPTAVVAGKPEIQPFQAAGILTDIDNGNVNQIGHSTLWKVSDRHIKVKFTQGDLNDNFILTYQGIFDLYTQAGDFVGNLVQDNGDTKAMVFGQVAPLTFIPVGKVGGGNPIIQISGTWTGVSGLKARGEFQASMVFIPDEYGHVAEIVYSGFEMTGKYYGK
jgi:hypothetical protein